MDRMCKIKSVGLVIKKLFERVFVSTMLNRVLWKRKFEEYVQSNQNTQYKKRMGETLSGNDVRDEIEML